METARFFRELFRAETLDTRFVPPPAIQAKNKQASTASLWRTREFGLYAVIFLVFVPLMITTAASAGRPSNPNYERFASRLSRGWLGPTVDNSDQQYSGFRDQLPILVALGSVHIFLRHLLKSTSYPARGVYDFYFSLILITALHGTGTLKILAILGLNYLIGKRCRSRAMSWAFGVGILFSNELLRGYPLPSGLEYGGILEQWQVYFKCTMMRMLSFNLDYLDAVTGPESRDPELKPSPGGEHERIDTPRPFHEYGFVNYVGYCLYAPLYLAGPILTFNDFQVQKHHTLTSITSKRRVAYAVRFVLCLLCMEVILHYIPVVSIAETRAWTGLTPAQISMVGFFNLVVIWLKLLIPWRFFRLWSLGDGIDPPENMIRCVANNYSALSFWRSWHRSFHRWVTRYLYIPLGGSRRQVVNSLIVFAFVALWHDIELRLFVWSFLIVLFVLPEIVCRALVPYKSYGSKWWYRYVAGIGAVGNIWMMLIANLVGFAVGVDGITQLLKDMTNTAAGLWFTILCSILLFVGVQVMFEYRESELRNGINLRC